MTYFGSKLRALRTERGLSQAELAQQLGLTKSSLNMYERGEREPNFRTLAGIAAYFGCDLNDLLGIPRTAHLDRIEAEPDAVPRALFPDEQALLAAYRALGPEGRDYVLRSAELARLSAQNERKKR